MSGNELGDVVRRKELAHEITELVQKCAWSIMDFRAWLFAETGREKITHMTAAELEAIRNKLKVKLAEVDKAVVEVDKEVEDILNRVERGKAVKEKVEIITPTSQLVDVSGTEAVVPVLTEQEAIAHFQRFQNLKRAVLTNADYMFIGRDGRPCEKKDAVAEYICKSGWRKIALMFNISVEMSYRQMITGTDKDGPWHGWIYRVRAIAPKGRIQEADGVCTTRNKFFCSRYNEATKQHEWIDTDEKNLICTAQTVAINRAISDLVGSGELSAEEIE